MKRALLVASFAAWLVLSTLGGSSRAQNNRLFGIYSAVVVSTTDPEGVRGRLKVQIFNSPTAPVELWARPSVPYVDGTAGSIKLPPVNSQVWVQFEAGEPTRPVWVGWTPRPGT